MCKWLAAMAKLLLSKEGRYASYSSGYTPSPSLSTINNMFTNWDIMRLLGVQQYLYGY